MRIRTSDFRGFTLIELVVVLLVLAILSVFVAQKIGNVTAMKAAAFAKKLRADVRYAQNVAMTGNRRTRVYFNCAGSGPKWAPAAGYAVVVDGISGDCSAFDWVKDPSGTGYPTGANPAEKAALKVDLSAADYAGITVVPTVNFNCLEYDSLGSPFNCSGAPPGVCPALATCAPPAAAGGMTITIPAAPAAVNTVTVAAGTGAVN